MMKLTIVAAVGLILAGTETFAQMQRPQSSALREAPPDSSAYVREGADVPQFVVVRTFFNTAFISFTGSNWRSLIGNLGIEHESAADYSLRKAMFLAKAIDSHVVDLLPYRLRSPEVIEAVQIEAVRRRVHALRRVFYSLREELLEAGVSLGKLDHFLEQQIRPSITMSSFPEPDYELFATMAEFEAKGPVEPLF